MALVHAGKGTDVVRDQTTMVTDDMVEAARLAQGRATLGGRYRDSDDPEDIDTALFYAIPPDEMRAALEAALR